MENELVRYSRAGDVFHYRWAARRCLRMINPNSPITKIVIEGSKESNLAGEYVIDVAEYSKSLGDDSKEIAYYQLKHTTVRKNDPFGLSDLKETIQEFSKRFIQQKQLNRKTGENSFRTFNIVTNRPLKDNFKRNIKNISNGVSLLNTKVQDKRFLTTLEKYTNLKGKLLRDFCASLRFYDEEGDYKDQRYKLNNEISILLAGTVDSPLISNIIEMVQQKALPDSKGEIVREDVYRSLGVSSERALFPASPKFEKIKDLIQREQHETLLKKIVQSSKPVIIHAAGGVGKTIVARQIADSLPLGSLGIVYDCFGSGGYRNRSEPRHRHRDALVQIANELTMQGLCDPLIALDTSPEDDILRKFLTRLGIAIKSLRMANKKAIIVIMIDAADNAEMAAKEYGHSCFVHELLRESMPEGCHLVALCRTERIDLLHPSSTIHKIELKSFSKNESLAHLRMFIPVSSIEEGLEFHSLTNGNPRVQANALSIGSFSLTNVLNSLRPSGITVEKQIEIQLDSIVPLIKEKYPIGYQDHIDSICQGLAILPPFIPISILSTAANVDESSVRSFAAEIGRPLWISETSVQFRDEPTETWFRQKFASTKGLIDDYIKRLKPLAKQSPYVAEALPPLLLQAERYEELIELALTDNLLPENSPIDRRNIQIFRLQFALKAALKIGNYSDAIKISMRAGEEVAGDQRQLTLFMNNIDLIEPLLSKERVQEIAFKRKVKGAWQGSENVYSASLLSTVEDFKGEARGFLIAAENWLRIYLEERKKDKTSYHNDELHDEDIVELAFIHHNLLGIHNCVQFILSWRPKEVIYRIASKFVKRFIDVGNYETIYNIAEIGFKDQHLIIAITHQLLAVGKYPPVNSLQSTLKKLSVKKLRQIKQDDSYTATTFTALMSFLEACVAKGLSKKMILRVLNHYFPQNFPRTIYQIYVEKERYNYLRAVALRSILTNKNKINIDLLLPKELTEAEQKYRNEQEIKKFKEVIGGLLPWYLIRAKYLSNKIQDLAKEIQIASKNSEDARIHRWHDSDFILSEITAIQFEILTYSKLDNSQIKGFYENYLKNAKIDIKYIFNYVRITYRVDHLSEIRNDLEQNAYHEIFKISNIDPETRAEWYINLARAVLPISIEDAKTYFNYAIESVSRFGDEVQQRWRAVASIAKRSTEGVPSTLEIAYRFIRCAELVSENISEKYGILEDAISICARLSPTSSFAALSRWRDRDVGRFESQILALATEMISSGYLSPTMGWPIASFFEANNLAEFALLCIEKESSKVNRQNILDRVVTELRKRETEEKYWHKLEQVAKQYSLINNELESILLFFRENPSIEEKEKYTHIPRYALEKKKKRINWDKLLEKLDLTSSSGISDALKRYKSLEIKYDNYSNIWSEIFNRIDEGDILKFINALIIAENADLFEIKEAFYLMPSTWRSKVSVKSNWGIILETIAQRFAVEFTNYYTLKYFLDRINEKDNVLPFIRSGILKGLSKNVDLIDADTLFGFVEIATPFISSQQAMELLNFSLNRLELHIDDDYADGNWSDWLIPPSDVKTAFAGIIWAALGSPRSKIRWQAVHCVKRLSEVNSSEIIIELINWMEIDDDGPFGCKNFPFYSLHSRQYLLIALLRISIDNPNILFSKNRVFSKNALNSSKHILIQKYSADIALNIEKVFPGTCSDIELELLNKVGKSNYPVKDIRNHQEQFEYSQDKSDNDIDRIKYYFGWDFDRYWFEPLGRVFGISSNQVKKLATDVLRNEWQIKNDGSYKTDPRLIIWNSSRNERETWHDHGNYPRTDNLSFYQSYHSMLIVASKLLEQMPVVQRSDWEEDEWLYWLKRHLLTRTDGCWLADRRDSVPLISRKWISEKVNESWREDISEKDFINGLFFKWRNSIWLTVDGSWEIGDDNRKEYFSVSSALVSPIASQSLINALSACPDSINYIVNNDEEEETEFDLYPFKLNGWIRHYDTSLGVDKYDPFAEQIPYPSYQIKDSILEQFKMSFDTERRQWWIDNSEESNVMCDIWSSEQLRDDEEPLRRGIRMSASKEFLIKLCQIQKCDLIIEIEINRIFKRKLYSENNDETEYKPPKRKIYIFSSDGGIRDERKNYKLR